jgi:hypothetical protein
VAAVIPEDGTGVSGSDSYFAIATATTYWANRPQDPNAAVWTAAALVTGKQDGAAREATAYLDSTWGSLYRGVRLTDTQGLLWPRIDRTALALTDCITTLAELEAEQAETDKPLIGADGLEMPGLPPQIVHAAIELAARACTARLAADKGEEGWLKRRKVGIIEREWGGPGIPGGSYGFVDTLLAPVLIGQRNAQWNWA